MLFLPTLMLCQLRVLLILPKVPDVTVLIRFPYSSALKGISGFCVTNTLLWGLFSFLKIVCRSFHLGFKLSEGVALSFLRLQMVCYVFHLVAVSSVLVDSNV